MAVEQGNVTLSLPADVLREARLLAEKQGISLSEYVAELLEQQVTSSRKDYDRAKESALRRLKKGYDLGTHGKITWTREELYDRKL